MQLQLPWKSRHKPRNFQNLKCKLAANALDISVTLFYTIDLENSTFILTRRGAEAILFLTKAEIANSNKTVKKLSHQGPRTPQGGCTGVLVSEMEGRGPFFAFARVVTYTPQ